MSTQNAQPLQQLRTYLRRSQEYLANAYLSLERNEIEKASEFFWGSIAEAIKAVAALEGRELPSHRSVQVYMQELARELGDSNLWDGFRDAQSLHTNFYESDLTVEVVLTSEARVRYAIGRLLSMIPREVLEQ